MKKVFIVIIAASGCFGVTKTQGGVLDKGFLSESASIEINSEEKQLGQPEPKPGRNKGMRRMRNKLFTVNLFKYNKKVRERRDRELKALAKSGKKSDKAHKGNKKSKHILLRGSDNNHGFKNKRRW